jgi:hypothetical protein
MTTPTPARSPSTEQPPVASGEDRSLEKVFRGGWFIAEDVNGDRMVVRLPARVEIGA